MRKRLLLPIFALIITLSPLAALPGVSLISASGQDQAKITTPTDGLRNECGGDQCG